MASRMSACSVGSSNTWNQGASASDCACAVASANRYSGGVGSFGFS